MRKISLLSNQVPSKPCFSHFREVLFFNVYSNYLEYFFLHRTLLALDNVKTIIHRKNLTKKSIR